MKTKAIVTQTRLDVTKLLTFKGSITHKHLSTVKMAASLNVPKVFRLHRILVSYKNARFLSLHISQRFSSSGSGGPGDSKHASIQLGTQNKPISDKPSSEPVKGKIFAKQPIKILLETGKDYIFCTCGYSKTQPFCDSSHKAKNFVEGRPHHFRYKPLPFTVEETKEYYLCLCKQSKNRPFCDGTHKRPDIQDAVLT